MKRLLATTALSLALALSVGDTSSDGKTRDTQGGGG